MNCVICEHAASDGFDKCPHCNRVFETCPTCGSKLLEKVSQNLPEADSYPLLSEVLAEFEREITPIEDGYYDMVSFNSIKDVLNKYFS